MASGQPGTSTAAQTLDNRGHLFRLQMLIIDGGLLVLRSYVDQKLTAVTISLSACLANEKSIIVNLRRSKTITKVQYDLLFPSSGNVSTSDLDITLIVSLLRNIKFFGLNPKFNWNTLPAPGDTSIEAAIYNLKRYRNEMSHASSTTGIQHSTFKTLWRDIKEILLRINSFSVNPIADLKQTIKEFKSCPIDPKTEKRVHDEIEKWKELEKAVEVDLSIVKAGHKRLLKDVKKFKVKMAKVERENKSKGNINQAMTESQYQQRKQGDEDPFYLAVVTHNKSPAECDQWFLRGPIGRNKLNSLLKTMAVKANLPELQFGKRITNTSVRKRLCQKLLENEVPDTHAVHVTGHKNPSSLNNYRALTNVQQKSISNLLAAPVTTSVQANTISVQANTVVNSASTQSVDNHAAFISLPANCSFCLFSNTTITGGTFNITLQQSNSSDK